MADTEISSRTCLGQVKQLPNPYWHLTYAPGSGAGSNNDRIEAAFLLQRLQGRDRSHLQLDSAAGAVLRSLLLCGSPEG